MKFITHNHSPQNPTKRVYLKAQKPLESGAVEPYNGPVAGDFLSQLRPTLKTANENNPILQSEQTAGYGIHTADTVENFEARIKEVIDQGTDGAISAGIGGTYLSKAFTPPEFKGYFNMYLLSPRFWINSGLSPASVIASQLQEGFDSLGDPAELLGNSPLLSIKMAKALANKDEVNAAINGAHSGGGHLDSMSLTSLQILEQVNESAFKAVSRTNVSRAAEFFAKSGYNLDTGERDPETGAVWWKRGIRKIGLAQNWQYRKRVNAAKILYKEGYDEVRSNIRSLKRLKEESVFEMQQEIDQYFIPKTAKGEADTVGLDAGRRVLHLIINRPEQFARNPKAFEVNGVSAKTIFGSGFNPIDVLEALRAPKYEFLTNRPDEQNHLEAAIKTGQWQFSHYNALSTLKGLEDRAQALAGFSKTNLETLEQHINQHYEPNEKANIDLNHPGALVGEIIEALGSAGVALNRNINKIITKGNIYNSANELLWYLFSFFGQNKNLSAFKTLPPALQGKVAQFFLAKRSQLEKDALSGGINEKGSLIWRVEALRQGRIIAENTEALANELPTLATKLISTDQGVAQAALRTIKTLSDSYNFFLDLIGVTTKPDGTLDETKTDSLLQNLPEFEQSILSNIIDFYPKIKGIYGVYTQLQADRKDIEKSIDQDPEKIAELQAEYDRKSRLLESSRASGLDGLGGFIDAVPGTPGAAGGVGGGDVETYSTTLRVRLKEIQDILYGTAGSTDGGAYGKIAKIKNSTFENLPGDISHGLQRIAAISYKSIDNRLKELGLESDSSIETLLHEDKKPDLNTLARNELYNTVSKSIISTAEALLGNETQQQFENMAKTAYVGLQTLTFAPANYQSRLTAQSLRQPEVLTDALYVRQENGGYLYHTKTQIILITPPRLNSADHRNVAIWNKTSHEIGLDQKFTIPNYNNPDQLGIFLTANPENSAASQNILIAPFQSKINDLLAANKNLAPKHLAA